MATVQQRKFRLWQDKVETEIEVSGSGPPLVYLHGPWGLRGDRPFLDLLSAQHSVYAPKHPGTSTGDPDAVHRLDDWLDLIVYHGELLDRLELAAPVFVGHSFGGLVACEIAAMLPGRVKRLALIDPIGLWRDDKPVRNWMIFSEEQRRQALFADPAGAAAQRFFALPDEAGALVEAQSNFIWSQACTGKFVWPIPDKSLKKRIHRIAAPTLVIWGAKDGVIAPDYAQEFAAGIAGARVETIDCAAHLPHLEQAEQVARLVNGFLAG